MSYMDALSSKTQSLVMLNFEFFGKKLLLFMALLFALYFVFYYWKNKKDTPYLLSGIWRIMLYVTSWIIIITFPMTIFFLYPQVPIDTVMQFMLISYPLGYFVAGVIITLNIFYHGTNILMSFAGVDVDPKSKKVYSSLFKETARVMGFKLK